jgi:ribosomal protein L22
MADQKKDTEQKKAPPKKPAARKTAAKSGGSSTRRSAAKPKETATKGSGTAAKASTKSAATKAAAGSTAEAKASKVSTPKQPAAKKAPARKAPAKKAETEPKPKRTTKQEAPERPVVNARARFVRVAPRKARLIADQVRGLPLEDALPLLRFSTRSAAQDIRKLLESAAANAEANHDLVADDLRIKDIHVDEGPTLRRYRPRALGRATRINKRTSHIAVALTPED